MSIRHWAAACVIGGISSAALAEWTQFRGPNYDGITTEKIAWPSSGPKQLWKVPVGEGFGTMVVSGDKVFVTAEGGGQEALLCLDAKNGKALWHREMGRSIQDRQGGNGPRTTPAVDGNLVYAFSTWFNLIACDVNSGRVVWSHDFEKQLGGQSKTSGISKWGNASSPIVDDKYVYAAGGGPGQTFIAFDKATGKIAWKSGDEKVTHASPTLATIHGMKQVVFFVQDGVVGLDASNGKEMWRYKFPFAVSTATTPVVAGDIVFCSAGYKMGAGAARISKDWSVKEIWRNKDEHELANHWTSCVYKDGHLYGIFGFKLHGTAPLKCVELETGKVKWSKEGFGPGGTILAGDDLIVQGDQGQIAIVKATPEGYKETASGKFFDQGKCWNMAILSNGKLYARSAKKDQKDQPYIICLDVSGK